MSEALDGSVSSEMSLPGRKHATAHKKSMDARLAGAPRAASGEAVSFDTRLRAMACNRAAPAPSGGDHADDKDKSPTRRRVALEALPQQDATRNIGKMSGLGMPTALFDKRGDHRDTRVGRPRFHQVADLASRMRGVLTNFPVEEHYARQRRAGLLTWRDQLFRALNSPSSGPVALSLAAFFTFFTLAATASYATYTVRAAAEAAPTAFAVLDGVFAVVFSVEMSLRLLAASSWRQLRDIHLFLELLCLIPLYARIFMRATGVPLVQLNTQLSERGIDSAVLDAAAEALGGAGGGAGAGAGGGGGGAALTDGRLIVAAQVLRVLDAFVPLRLLKLSRYCARAP